MVVPRGDAQARLVAALADVEQVEDEKAALRLPRARCLGRLFLRRTFTDVRQEDHDAAAPPRARRRPVARCACSRPRARTRSALHAAPQQLSRVGVRLVRSPIATPDLRSDRLQIGVRNRAGARARRPSSWRDAALLARPSLTKTASGSNVEHPVASNAAAAAAIAGDAEVQHLVARCARGTSRSWLRRLLEHASKVSPSATPQPMT